MATGIEATEAIDLVGTDRLEPDEVQQLLDAGESQAKESVAAMRAGQIDRAPNGGSCPPWCRFQPICRLERSIGAEEVADNGDAPGNGAA